MLAPPYHGRRSVRSEDMHEEKDEAILVCRIDPPILVGPDLLRVVAQQLANETRYFSSESR